MNNKSKGMLEVSKVVFVAFTQHSIQSNVTHVRGVKSELFHILCTPLYEQKIKGCVKYVERDSKYIKRALMPCMLKVSKETPNTL